MKPSGQGFPLLGVFLITASISLGVICLFRLSDSSQFISRRSMLLGILPFCPGWLVCWHIIVHNISLKSFVFIWYQLNFSSHFFVFEYYIYLFLKYILLIMLLHFSQFLSPLYSPSILYPPLSSCIPPTLVHVHGLYI